MAHTPVDKKIGVDGALALLHKMKAMLVKMVVAEEAKTAALPAALSPSPSLDVLRSPLPSFPPPCQAMFKRCLTSLGRRKLASAIHDWLAVEVFVAVLLLGLLSPSPGCRCRYRGQLWHNFCDLLLFPSLLLPSPSLWALPMEAAATCSSIDIKTCIDGSLALLGEAWAIAEKMAAAEEAKRAAPPDTLSPSPTLIVLHYPPPTFPPMIVQDR
jgi:hypothetical protein